MSAGQFSPFSHGPHLRPGDVGVYPSDVSAVGASDDVLPSHYPGVVQDSVGRQLRGLYGSRLVGNDSGNEYLPIRKFKFFPDFLIQLMADVRRFQGDSAGIYLEDKVNDVPEGRVGCMGTALASPAGMEANLVFGNIA